MTFRTDNSQTSGIFHLLAQLDVGTTTGHIGSNSYSLRFTGFCNNIRFFLVQLGIQYVVPDTPQLQHTAQQLGNLDRSRTHQHRTTGIHQLHDFFDHGIVFLTLGFINKIIGIDTHCGTVGRDHHHIEFVNIPKLSGFRFRRTGHTGQFMIHTEIILQSNSRPRLSSGFHFYIFLGLDSLVQSVGITAAFHDTAGLLVHNLHFIVQHHIFDVFLKQSISFQQLVHRMYPLRFHRIALDQFILFLQSFFLIGHRLFYIGDFRAYIR